MRLSWTTVHLLLEDGDHEAMAIDRILSGLTFAQRDAYEGVF